MDKVKYAKSKGLLGLAVWSIDLDDDDHHLLNATLYPGGLGSLSLTTGTNQTTRPTTPTWTTVGAPGPTARLPASRTAPLASRYSTSTAVTSRQGRGKSSSRHSAALWAKSTPKTMGGADPTPEESTNADKNSFGWYIMSGPQDELTSLNKRDGSHWSFSTARRGHCTRSARQSKPCVPTILRRATAASSTKDKAWRRRWSRCPRAAVLEDMPWPSP